MKRRFVPSARQTNWLLTVAFLSVGYALYLRYRAIEFAPVSLECQGGLDTWLCGTFRAVIVLFNHAVFGAVALGAAVINLLRPSVAMFAIALGGGRFRHRVAQSRPLGARRRAPGPQPGATRTRTRVTASIASPAHSSSACQLAIDSLSKM